jgi:predicted helicase
MIIADFFAPVASWADFTKQQTCFESHARGRPFESLVRHYLQADRAYRAKLKHAWLLEDVPDEVRSRLHLPRPNQGIDLVAETYAGEFWAIQAKYRTDTDAALTHQQTRSKCGQPHETPHLATFTSLAFTVCQGISYSGRSVEGL